MKALVLAITGLCSWYGHEHDGDTMANGQVFIPHALTVAADTYDLGTKLRITNHNAPWLACEAEVTDRLGEAARRKGVLLDVSEGVKFKVFLADDVLRGNALLRVEVLK